MTQEDLKVLVGCILVYKLHEIIIIKEVVNDNVILLIDGFILQLHISDFIEQYLSKIKIYLTEDNESLVSVGFYLKHYY